MFIDGKAHNMPNVLKLCTEEVYNLHVSALNILCLIYTNLPHP